MTASNSSPSVYAVDIRGNVEPPNERQSAILQRIMSVSCRTQPDREQRAEVCSVDIDSSTLRLWHRGMLDLTNEALNQLKSWIFDPDSPSPEPGEISSLERLFAFLRDADEAALALEYQSWCEQYPGTTAAIVRSARKLERSEHAALRRFINQLAGVAVTKPAQKRRVA